MNIRLFLLYATLASYTMAESTQRCYLPDGSPDSSYNTPCDASAQFSHCCNIADICLTNGYCFSVSQSTVYRPSCTDPTFKDESCPYYCSDVVTNAGPQLIPTNDVPPLFCCNTGYNSTSDKCQTSTHSSLAPFPLEAASVIYNRTSGSTGPNHTTASPAILPQSSHDLSIGLGVGLPLGLLLLLVSSLLWREKQQQKKSSNRWAVVEKGDQIPEQVATQYDSHGSEPELGGRPMNELGEGYRAVELESR